jgi:hypothetical protein
VNLLDRIRASVRGTYQPGPRTAPDTDPATTGGPVNHIENLRFTPARPNYDRDPAYRQARTDEAARLSGGAPVTISRDTANYLENLLIRILAVDEEVLPRIGYGYEDLTVAGCRLALSDAIAAADEETRQDGPPAPDDPADSVDETLALSDGVVEGRRQAAADIRGQAVKYAGAQYRNFEMCARIAERRK